jgi:hypothetical protein
MAPGAGPMLRKINREQRMFDTRHAATGGSKTQDNFADAGAMGIDPGLVGQVLAGNWGGALKSALAAGSNFLNGNTAAVREHVGRILLQRGQSMNPQALQSLVDEAVSRLERLRTVAQQAAAGAAGGLAVAPAALSPRKERK